jgi:hypothetical protein
MGSMAIGQDNRIHTAWSEWEESDSDHDIYYAYSDDGGSLWSTPENVCDDSRVSGFPNVIVDSSNRVHIIWDDGSGNTPMLWTYQSGDTWTSPVNIAEGSPGGEYPTAILDKTNRIWAFWTDYSGTPPQNFTNETVACAHPNATVDSENNIYLVWTKYGTYPSDIDIYYSKYNGVEWSAPEKVESLPGYSCDAKIDIDSEGRPWVIWQERYGGYRLYYTYRDSTGWLPPTLIENEDRFIHNFVIDSTDYLHLFWEANGPVHYSFFDGDSWSTSQIISDTLPGNSFCEDVMIDGEIIHLVFKNNPRPGGDTCNIYYINHNLTGIETEPKDVEERMTLRVFPNPFRDRFTIFYTLPEAGYVRLQVSDILGRILVGKDLGYRVKGYHTYSLSAELLRKGSNAHTGVYFYSLKVDGAMIATGKMVVLR